MNAIRVSLDELRAMIGLVVKHQGERCQVVEVLEDGPSLVLINMEHQVGIQADQHGEARRRVPTTYTVAVLSPEADEFSPAFLALEPLAENDELPRQADGS